MNHPAELSIRAFLDKAVKGKATMSDAIIENVVEDLRAALKRQFSGKSRDAFKLRPSGLGKPKCQLWFEKNKPETAEPLPSNFMFNMIIGDIVEAIFKGVLRASEVDFVDSATVKTTIAKQDITGEYDLTIDNRVDDIKSASAWSYSNKFADYNTLSKNDSFGYVSQLAIYAKALGVDVGGWWVLNKANGDFKYVSARQMDTEEVMSKVEDTINYIVNDEPFERCFSDVPETYRGVPSGNTVLPIECRFCRFKYSCWDNIKEMPSKVSKAKEPPMVEYITIADAA
tara:strand:- start:253 stop:1107 length:855 start_codon:yes stop_codon:yes gene_type:complete